MAQDSDGFNRWDAAQTLAQRLLLAMIRDPAVEPPASFLDAFRRALVDAQAEPALRAEILTLPSEGYLGDQMEVVDVDGIHRAREALRAAIGGALRADLLALYRESVDEGPYEPTPEASGRRALKSLCLAYLVQTGDEEALALCQAQLDAHHNMTDVMAALRLFVDQGGEMRDLALADFYQRWSDDPLVLDKWFSIQATSSREDTLGEVRRLLAHPAYSNRNPNRVRSLVGAFCAGNQVRFHAADGGGYRFLREQVLELDPLNPQIASRLLQSMVRWRRFDPARQELMRAELGQILAVEDLSKDVYEVATKALADV
jgi:aminopeptidase N